MAVYEYGIKKVDDEAHIWWGLSSVAEDVELFNDFALSPDLGKDYVLLQREVQETHYVYCEADIKP